MGLHVMYVAR